MDLIAPNIIQSGLISASALRHRSANVNAPYHSTSQRSSLLLTSVASSHYNGLAVGGTVVAHATRPSHAEAIDSMLPCAI
ncbi:hypothetical protein KC331_g64 [Hortaea werneckii]|nr:hypothetical protein KC331_g64 [Hortaea werneckii]